jgi:hypothetical protein
MFDELSRTTCNSLEDPVDYWEQFYEWIAHCIARVLCSFSERKCAAKAVSTGLEAAMLARIVPLSRGN